MRLPLALVLAAGLSVASRPAGAQPAEPIGGQPAPAPAPAALPVPDGPVVNSTTLESGLLIEDITIGDGYEVPKGGAVVVNYHGTLKDGGKVFDSSFERGEPIAFSLNGVIPGWQEGVPGMKIGGVRRLTIPSEMAYGPTGAGEDIPPNSDLVFVIQLVDALQIEDIKVGEGPQAEVPFVAVTTHVIKDADGNVIETADASNPYVWVPGEYEPIFYGVEGMKVGGTRRLSVPAMMNMTPAELHLNRPNNVPVTIELELIALRNLPRRR